MPESTYVTVVARLVIPIDGSREVKSAELAALSLARQQMPGLAWTVEHVEIPWGS